MALKEYPVIIGGIEHTMHLDEDDAQRLGVTESKKRTPVKAATKAAPTTKDKAAPTAKNKTAPADDAAAGSDGTDW